MTTSLSKPPTQTPQKTSGTPQPPARLQGAARRQDRRKYWRPVTLVVLVVLLAGVGLVSIATGQYQLPMPEVFGALQRRVTGLFGGPIHQDSAQQMADSTIMNVRFPRVLLGIIVGAGLGIAGAAMQGIFANPLAEPGIIGVSSGAALGASLAIVFAWDQGFAFAVPLSAFVGGVFATWLVYMLSRSSGKSVVLTLVLTGIAINAVAGAGIAFLTFMAETTSREQIVFWQLGSLNGATWQAVGTAGAVVLFGILVLTGLSRKLDVLALGDKSARQAGIHVERVRVGAILTIALVTAAAVSYAGIISFVGLVVPHALRLLIGPGHKYLLPLSALGGAVLLMSADIFARTLIPFADMPIGIFTALVGGPVFFILLRQTLKKQGVL
ncbi:FecCD family ABC transporter permease [Micrococcoides hystricis]|uniref:FecCD family ABC transporter permease n=1 Tax=Micrococcoides hystricis TaxID=1572761 RepID=A0ABV6PAL3_9MICC